MNQVQDDYSHRRRHRSRSGPRSPAAPWLGSLARFLDRHSGGMVALLWDATPSWLGPVVRLLSPAAPWATDDREVLKICLTAPQLAHVAVGSRVLLRVRPDDVDWLNLCRPIVTERNLRLVLWADMAASDALKKNAPDFSSWISRAIRVPEAPAPDNISATSWDAAAAALAEVGCPCPELLAAWINLEPWSIDYIRALKKNQTSQLDPRVDANDAVASPFRTPTASAPAIVPENNAETHDLLADMLSAQLGPALADGILFRGQAYAVSVRRIGSGPRREAEGLIAYISIEGTSLSVELSLLVEGWGFVATGNAEDQDDR